MIDALKRILGRIEKHVAIAGVLCGSVASMNKLFPQMEKFSDLTVIFCNGSSVSWICCPFNPAQRGPWVGFQRWYHGRPQSEVFVMRYKEGAHCFRRRDIMAYRITNGEREKQPSPSGDKGECQR